MLKIKLKCTKTCDTSSKMLKIVNLFLCFCPQIKPQVRLWQRKSHFSCGADDSAVISLFLLLVSYFVSKVYHFTVIEIFCSSALLKCSFFQKCWKTELSFVVNFRSFEKEFSSDCVVWWANGCNKVNHCCFSTTPVLKINSRSKLFYNSLHHCQCLQQFFFSYGVLAHFQHGLWHFQIYNYFVRIRM